MPSFQDLTPKVKDQVTLEELICNLANSSKKEDKFSIGYYKNGKFTKISEQFIPCIVDNMQKVKKVFKKESGRAYAHLMITLPNINADQKLYIDEEFMMNSEDIFKDFEAITIVSKINNNLQCHIIINSVSHTTGAKFRYSPESYHKLCDIVKSLKK